MQRHHAASIGTLVLALMLSILWFVGNAGQAHACSCGPPVSPPIALEMASAVFTGRIVSIQLNPDDPYEHVVEFKVNAVWKGSIYETMYVTTYLTGASCGYAHFEVDGEYIVYAGDRYRHGNRDGYSVGFCLRTGPLVRATADLEELGEGRAPEPGTIASLPEDLVGLVAVTLTPTAKPAPTSTPEPAPTPTPEPPPHRSLHRLWQ